MTGTGRNVDNELLRNICIHHVLDGVRDGLSHFSGQSRVALIYALAPDDSLRIYDPQHLLRDHEPKLREIFFESNAWREGPGDSPQSSLLQRFRFESLPLSGLISFGGRFENVFYQMWFTEHHPDMCSLGPTSKWLERAAWLLSRDLKEANPSLATSGYVLQEYATHAVHDHLVDERSRLAGPDSPLRIYPILDSVLGVSKTREEGAWARGNLVFAEAEDIEAMRFIARFREDELPDLRNFKHVRKLLQTVEPAMQFLVSDGSRILGVARGDFPESSIVAEFRGGHGFLRLGENYTCSFSDGRFQSTNRRANLVHLEEALLESGVDPSLVSDLYLVTAVIVRAAQERKHGCTLVIDLKGKADDLSGQYLENPLDMNRPDHLSLAKALSKVDGALHLGIDLKLYGFACLLDGPAVAGENRARGARFNSALRFTTKHENRIVVVVSSDRPVSVIQGGVELSAACELPPISRHMMSPPTLGEWIAA